MEIVPVSDPFEWLSKEEILAVADEGDEKNLRYQKWYGVLCKDQKVLLLSTQKVTDEIVMVAGWALSGLHKTLLARTIYRAWLEFLRMLRKEGYEKVFATTLKTNMAAINFNLRNNYILVDEDSTMYYWFKELKDV